MVVWIRCFPFNSQVGDSEASKRTRSHSSIFKRICHKDIAEDKFALAWSTLESYVFECLFIVFVCVFLFVCTLFVLPLWGNSAPGHLIFNPQPSLLLSQTSDSPEEYQFLPLTPLLNSIMSVWWYVAIINNSMNKIQCFSS